MSEMELQTGAFASIIPCWFCGVAMSCVLISGCGGVQAGGEQSIQLIPEALAFQIIDNSM